MDLFKLRDDIYVTKPFASPRQHFKLQIYGSDINDNTIERIISSAIQTTKPDPPSISLNVHDENVEVWEGESLTLNCFVKSMIPATVKWYFKDTLIKESKSKYD